MNPDQELNRKLISKLENETLHMNYEQEYGYYRAIASGDLQLAKKMTNDRFEALKDPNEKNIQGVLSKDPIRNQKYHFAILSAIVARFCIDYGLDKETAYSLSDIYINMVDEASSIDEIKSIQEEMVQRYALLMQKPRTTGSYSKIVHQCIMYVNDHLNKKITTSTIAKTLHTNSSYLSKLFSTETGMTLSSYIKEQRLHAAANMLTYTDNSISEISEYYNFSNQSYFTNLFQKAYGTTPKKYRDQNYNKRMT